VRTLSLAAGVLFLCFKPCLLSQEVHVLGIKLGEKENTSSATKALKSNTDQQEPESIAKDKGFIESLKDDEDRKEVIFKVMVMCVFFGWFFLNLILHLLIKSKAFHRYFIFFELATIAAIFGIVCLASGNLTAALLLLSGAGASAFLLIYFIPTYVCCVRDTEMKTGIILLNIFLGWSFLGWVGALIWASVAPPKSVGVSDALTNLIQILTHKSDQ
jgi:hypothetical protein